MSEKAIEILEAAKAAATERYHKEVSEIDASIARLRTKESSNGKGKLDHLGVRPGQYAGIKGSKVLWPYLLERQGELPLPMKVVIADLKMAGADLGDPSREERNLKISSSNNDLYIYDEATDTWDLTMAREARGKQRRNAS
jgi:hypothetical protein